jgi:hypothetical protein
VSRERWDARVHAGRIAKNVPQLGTDDGARGFSATECHDRPDGTGAHPRLKSIHLTARGLSMPI